MQIDLSNNELCGLDHLGRGTYTDVGIKAIADAIVRGSLMECNVRGNKLDVESAMVLAKVATEKRVMLFGIRHDQTEADFQRRDLKPPDAVLIANDISVSRSLTAANLLSNQFDTEIAAMLLKIKDDKPQLVTLCGLTHQETELDLKYKSLSPGDAMLLAPEIAVSHSLTAVDLQRNMLDDEAKQSLRECVKDRVGFDLKL